MNTKALNFLTALLTTMIWVDAVDFFWRCVSGLATLGMLALYYRSHRKKMRSLDLEEQIKQQQLYDLMEQNKLKYPTK